MNKPKWTPGPWKWEGCWDDLVSVNGKKILCLEDDNACGDPECCGSASFFIDISNHADAHLIAAAPELYKVLNEIYCQGETTVTHEVARIALCRARGEDPREDV